MGQPIPEKIKNKPNLNEDLFFYYQAFIDLDTTRSHANGATAISWLSIVEYAKFYHLDQEETLELVLVIRAMDKVNLERINNTLKEKHATN